jgi:RNA processing factor Prp31
MDNVFFKDGEKKSFQKMLKANEQTMRLTRIAQAQNILQQLKQEIKQRTEKLDEIYSFVENQHRLHEELMQNYVATPSETLGKRLESLKQSIDNFEKQIKQTQPEKIIADLTNQYEDLRAKLAIAVNNVLPSWAG